MVQTWPGRCHSCSRGKTRKRTGEVCLWDVGECDHPAVSLWKGVCKELVWLKPTGGTTLKKLVRRGKLLSPLLGPQPRSQDTAVSFLEAGSIVWRER